MLSRRQFLTGTGAVVIVGTGLDDIVLGSAHAAPTSGKKRRITFEEALKDSNVRQQYTIQTLEDLFGHEQIKKYFANIIYDHDNSLIKKYYGITQPKSGSMVIINYDNEYASGKMSDLHVLPPAFEGTNVNFGVGRWVYPTEIKFKSQLAHEFLHAFRPF